MAVITGTVENNSLNGTPASDIIYPQGGNDTADGAEGNDVLYGGQGDDCLFGGPADDRLYGGQGNDCLDGGVGFDILFGGAGNDTLDGGAGNNLLFGDEGNDFLFRGLESNTLTGGVGDDTFFLALSPGQSVLVNAAVITDYGTGNDVLQFEDGRVIVSNGVNQINLNSLGNNFTDLNIFQGSGENLADAIIQNNLTGEFVVLLKNVSVISSPTPTPDTLVPTPTPDTLVPTPTPDTLTPENFPPVDIILSPNTVVENSPSGQLVGVFNTEDPDGTDTHTYTLLDDAGNRFQLIGNQLFVNTDDDNNLDFETDPTHTITVQTTDSAGNSLTKNLVVFVVDVNEINEVPIANPDFVTTSNLLVGTIDSDFLSVTSDAPTSIPFETLLANDFAPQGNSLTITNVGNAVNGNVVLTATSVDFLPTVNPPAKGSFEYTISDGALTANAPVTVTIQTINQVDGLAGNDTIVGGIADDSLFGNEGDDSLVGNDGNDSLLGGLGSDTLAGGVGNDSLDGGEGDDFLEGGAGVDVITGGAGADSFFYRDPLDGGGAFGNTEPTGEIITDFEGTDFEGTNDVIILAGNNFAFLEPFPRSLNTFTEYSAGTDINSVEAGLPSAVDTPAILAVQSGDNVNIYYDADGFNPGNQIFLVQLPGQNFSQITPDNFILI